MLETIGPLLLSLSLATGIMPNYGRLDGSTEIAQEARYFLDVGVELQALQGKVFAGFSEHTESLKVESYYFGPISQTYTVGAGARLNGFELGWAHECTHPVLTVQRGNQFTDPMGEGFDTLYVKWKGTFEIK